MRGNFNRTEMRARAANAGALVASRPGHMAALGRKGGKACAATNPRRANGQYRNKHGH